MRADVLRIVLYFDVFAWPVRRSEVVRLVAPHDERAVEAVLDALVVEGLLGSSGAFVFLAGRDAIVADRVASNARAELLWPDAQRAAAVLARLPYVRAVLITGGLSKNAAGLDPDVDFLLIVATGRVWTTKSALQVVRRVLPPAIRDLCCTNYLVDEAHLGVDDRTAYTAMELATAVPMWNGPLCRRLFEENAWASAYVPGWSWVEERGANAQDPRRGRVTSALERVYDVAGDALDERLLGVWDTYWNRKYAFLDDATRAQRFKRRRERSTNHLEDFQFRVLDAWRERLGRYGLDEPMCAERTA